MKDKRILVVAPHPDDEVFGCGGVIARAARMGAVVHVLIVTKGDELFDQQLIERGRTEALEAHKLLGVADTHFLDLPAIKLDTLPQYRINGSLLTSFKEIRPDLLFIPHLGDINRDHQIVHACAMVAARPKSIDLAAIYSYETLSSTNWNTPGLSPAFTPNVFVDVTDVIDLKIKAAKTYASQMSEYPHERSPESVMILSQYRGGFVGIHNAEAFMLLREVVR